MYVAAENTAKIWKTSFVENHLLFSGLPYFFGNKTQYFPSWTLPNNLDLCYKTDFNL